MQLLSDLGGGWRRQNRFRFSQGLFVQSADLQVGIRYREHGCHLSTINSEEDGSGWSSKLLKPVDAIVIQPYRLLQQTWRLGGSMADTL